MAIVAVTEIHTGRSVSADEKGVRTLQRVFRVQTDDPYTEQLTVLGASGIPIRGQTYSTTGGVSDITLTVRARNAVQDEDRLFWTVTIGYSDKRTSEKDREPNPLLRDAEISRGFASFTKIAEKAVNDNFGEPGYGDEGPIVNSAGQPFVPPAEVDDPRYVLTITKNFATYSDDVGYQYRNAVNSDSWFGASERTWKIFNISVPPKITETVNDEEVEYFPVTVEMHFRPETWDLDIQDRGLKEFVTTGVSTNGSTGLKDIMDSGGQPHAEPQLLDGKGSALTGSASQASYRKYRYYPEKPFNSLGLIP